LALKTVARRERQKACRGGTAEETPRVRTEAQVRVNRQEGRFEYPSADVKHKSVTGRIECGTRHSENATIQHRQDSGSERRDHA